MKQKIEYKSGDTIKLIIDEKTLKDYNQYYFDKYPKRRVAPIIKPLHPSLNKWIIMKRPQMNDTKQKWREFIVWFIAEEGLSNLKIQSCSIECISYHKTKIRVDVDNTIPKFILDGLVSAGLIIDDDYQHIQSLTLRCGYDKDNPRTEIIIYIL